MKKREKGSRQRTAAWRKNARYIVSLYALARNLHVDAKGLKQRALKHGLEIRKSPYGPYRVSECVTPETEQILREIYKDQREAVPAGYLSMKEACQVLKMDEAAFRRKGRNTGLQRVRVGRSYYYHPVDVARLAQGEKRGGLPPRPPRGSIGTGELTELLELRDHRTVYKWREWGCPAYKMTTGFYYFKLPEVLKWLEGKKDWRWRRHERIVREALKAKKAA